MSDGRWVIRTASSIFATAHIPGAVFVNLDEELASPPSPDEGRHPLPSLEDLQAAARRWGIDDGDSVVLYDATGKHGLCSWLVAAAVGRTLGCPTARRRAAGLGVRRTAVGGRVSASPSARADVTFTGGNMPTVDIDGVGNWTSEGGVLLDARAGERYRGEVEPMDPVAGHIPGAVNAPTAENITGDGRFLDTTHLRERFAGLGVGDKVAVYCGSGVTAAHEIAALAIAGYDADAVPGLVVTVVQRQHSRRRHRSLSQLLVRSMNDGTRNHSAVKHDRGARCQNLCGNSADGDLGDQQDRAGHGGGQKGYAAQGESVGPRAICSRGAHGGKACDARPRVPSGTRTRWQQGSLSPSGCRGCTPTLSS